MTTEARPEIKITVEYRPGRWGQVFHIFDLDGREIAINQKDAFRLARNILRIVRGGKGEMNKDK